MTASMQDNVQMKAELYKLWSPLSDLVSFFAYLNSSNIHAQTAAYLRFGAARRMSVMLEDVRWLSLQTPPDRTQALSDEESRAADLHLNSLYLHLRGTLDNFAWALFWQFAPTEAQRLDESGDYMAIGLFKGSLLQRLPAKCSLKKVIESLHGWNTDLKLRRDPVAHRLPLRVIPQILVGDEAVAKYNEKHSQLIENVNRLANTLAQGADEYKQRDDGTIESITERCNQIDQLAKQHKEEQRELCQEMESLGTFVPVFTYAPANDELIRLYPTITDDCNSLLKIGVEVKALLESVS